MSERHESTFSLRTTVRVSIGAAPRVVWSKLTDAAAFPTWNSTVESLEGPIVAGQRLAIRVPAAPGRTFRPRVVVFEPERRMVWADGFAPLFRGVRTFTLTPDGAGTTFEMAEEILGLMVPLAKGSLPDFGPIFDRYAADLKTVCESG
ncbi:MAG: SRPBCC domain-containing protein [Polyangiaceae bacterium]